MGAQPVVAVVGRPNVGKSTLVNRLLGRREAIVEERPGVTRDRKVVEVEWGGRRFSVVDTGGWSARGAGIDEKVSRQSERAWREADVVLLVVDASVGVTAEDREVAARVRTGRAPSHSTSADRRTQRDVPLAVRTSMSSVKEPPSRIAFARSASISSREVSV